MSTAATAHVVLAADGPFAIGAWIAMWTTARHWHGPRALQFHLLTQNDDEPGIRRLRALAGRAGIALQIHRVDMQPLRELPALRFTQSTYLRILAPQLLPGLAQFLYLDADVLVRKSLAPLFEPVDAPISAVCEFGIPTLAEGLPYLPMDVQTAQRPYFNAGVLLIDVVAWQAAHLTERLLAFLHEHRAALINADQDAFNGVLQGGIRALDFTWNVQVDGFPWLDRRGWPEERRALQARRAELLRTAAVVHFLGSRKPWHQFLATPYAAEYRAALLASGWLPPHRRLSHQVRWTADALWIAGRRVRRHFRPANPS